MYIADILSMPDKYVSYDLITHIYSIPLADGSTLSSLRGTLHSIAYPSLLSIPNSQRSN